MNSKAETIASECIILGVQDAMKEADTTPLLPGVTVGQVNVLVYGNDTGTLLSINGDNVTVQLASGEVTWPLKGTVDIARVNFFIRQNIQKAIQAIRMIDAIQQIFGAALGDPEIPGLTADDPTPGCDCPRCSQFTPEQHEDARRRMEAALANEGPKDSLGAGRGESVSDPLSEIFRSRSASSGVGGIRDDDDPYLPRFRKDIN